MDRETFRSPTPSSGSVPFNPTELGPKTEGVSVGKGLNIDILDLSSSLTPQSPHRFSSVLLTDGSFFPVSPTDLGRRPWNHDQREPVGSHMDGRTGILYQPDITKDRGILVVKVKTKFITL